MAKTRIRNWLGGAAAVLALVVAALVLVDVVHVRAVRSRASAIRVGASRLEVERILGKPDCLFPKSSAPYIGGPERWAYGSMFDWGRAFRKEPPYFFPFRIRLVAPSSDDVAVRFDDNGKVSSVRIPK